MGSSKELEQWEIAATLLEVYGDEIGAFVVSKVQACLRAGDAKETQHWTSIINKLEALNWGATDDDAPRQ